MSGEARTWTFGRFTVKTAQRQLLVDGAPARLGARAFDLLTALIERRDRVVGKSELLDVVWPDLIVEEGNLKVQISNLRRLLGPGTIATLPARGYRFTALLDVEAEPDRVAGERASIALRLPATSVDMVGRREELGELVALLRQHRVVTVLGAGGIGKTTLALAAARNTAEADTTDVVWIELAAIGRPNEVLMAVAEALRIAVANPEALRNILIAELKSRKLLLVFDNAEHVIEDVAKVAEALSAGCAQVRVLVTSQAPMKLPFERLFRLGPLSYPESGVTPTEALLYGAVALFCERATAVRQQFRLDASSVDAVLRICRGLDGLPLAIELAAARLPLFGLEGLAGRLGEQLRLLSGSSRNGPTRQQTLLAALEWSHGLLLLREKAVFRRLAVFVGGFTLDHAAVVAVDDALDRWSVIDVLGTLTDRSLVSVDGAATPRYRLLESARAFAWRQLEAAGELFATQQRHAQAMATFALRGEEALWRTPEPQWLAQNAVELDNMRAALDWSALHDVGIGVRLAGASFHLFNCMALMYESRACCDRLSPGLEASTASPRDKARFLRARSAQMRDVSVVAQHELALESSRMCRECGDDTGLYESLYAITRGFQTFPLEAVAAAQEMSTLEQSHWPPAFRALGKIAQSSMAYVEGRMAENRRALEAALPLVATAGADRLTMVVLGNLADHVLLMGPLEEAVSRGLELAALLRRTRRTALLPLALCNLANALLQQGATPAARQTLQEAFLTMRAQQWTWLRGFGDVYALLAAREGRMAEAACLVGWADEARILRGPRQPNESRCSELALDIIRAVLTGEQIDQLGREGAAFAPEQVQTATLGAAA